MKLTCLCLALLLLVISDTESATLWNEDDTGMDETFDAGDDTSTVEQELYQNSEDETFDAADEILKETEKAYEDFEDPQPIHFANEFDKPLNFECTKGTALDFIKSVHSNYREDRIFAPACAKPSLQFTGKVFWTHTLNSFDGKFTYECPRGYVATGVSSIHHNYYEDRTWKLQCSQLQTGPIFEERCEWTKYTSFDQFFMIHVPKFYFIKGMRSYHNNHCEDRSFSFKGCRIFVALHDRKENSQSLE